MSMLLYSNISIHADTRSRREPNERQHFSKSNACKLFGKRGNDNMQPEASPNGLSLCGLHCKWNWWLKCAPGLFAHLLSFPSSRESFIKILSKFYLHNLTGMSSQGYSFEPKNDYQDCQLHCLDVIACGALCHISWHLHAGAYHKAISIGTRFNGLFQMYHEHP